MKQIKIIFSLLRTKHYIKNFLIFLPITFSGQLLNQDMLYICTMTFFLFCLITSLIYITNDIHDIDADKRHPTKCKRPLAAGLITVKSANTCRIFLGIALTMLSVITFKQNYAAYGWCLAYIVLNVAYSCKLKKIPLLDILVLSLGFLIRTILGGVVIGITITNWVFLTVMAAAFYLSLGKRRNELLVNGERSRDTLSVYTITFLDKNMYLCLALTLVFYALACADTNTYLGMAGINLVWSVPLVVFTCFRYNMLLEGKSDGDPVEVIYGDPVLVFLVFIYVISIIALIYFY